jgi:hypothetical protein
VILPGENRYGSAVLCICRFVAGLDWLDTTFSCTEYKVWIRTQAKDVQQESAACRAVVNDVDFTSLCADIAAFFGPAIILLRLATLL